MAIFLKIKFKGLYSVLLAWAFFASDKTNASSKNTHQHIVLTQPIADSIGASVQYPIRYGPQILYALSFFPKIDGAKIEFREKRINSTMSCAPKITSLLRSRTKRVYRININSCANFSGANFAQLPLEAQIGILGHEFAHVLDYHSRSTFGVIFRGIQYIFPASRAKFEKSIDIATIEAGMGRYLYVWAHYALYESGATQSYIRYKKKIYLLPDEIKQIANE
jgi:hypothetical protein